MEPARNFLLILLAFLSFLIFQQWQETNQPESVNRPPIEASMAPVELATSGDTEGYVAISSSDMSSQLPGGVESIPTSQETPIEVTTDTLRVLIAPAGGNFISAELLQYKESLNAESAPINILENRNGRVYLAMSGLYGEGAPDYNRMVANYQSQSSHYALQPDDKLLAVDLSWTNPQGVVYVKRFTFERGSYSVKVEFIVTNQSGEKITNRMFTSLKRDTLAVDGENSSGLGMQSYLGPAYSTHETKYQKFSFDDLEEEAVNLKTQGGWVALLQHYFVSAWIPLSESSTNLIDSTNKNLEKAGLTQIRITQDWESVLPGQTKTFAAKLYVGPKIQSELEKVAPGLELTVDYGFLWWIGQPIFHLLTLLQNLVVNWGLAIIFVTLVIKTLLYPLARAQYRSFAKMRQLQPKLTAMKERYGDDRQAMGQKMMELYKKEKVNPLGGCLPLLIQMPVFIALYWVLMESVELRHAPFMLWITDLSVKDPYYVLPLLMGASMYLMQKMQPTPPTMDPMQAKMMQMMPVFMTVFFVFFPAGLVLYWLANNLISITQQLYITRQFEKEQNAGSAKAK